MVHPGSNVPPAPRRGGRRILPALIILAVLLGLGSPRPSSSGTAASSSSSSSSSSSHNSGEWKVGDCGGPDPDDSPNGYTAFGCGDSGATFKALDVQAASFMPDAIQCPAGTDLIIQVSISYGSKKSKGGGIPSKTVCGRNLSSSHPGDPGRRRRPVGQGRLRDLHGQGGPLRLLGLRTAYKVLALVKETSQCPSGTTEPMRLTMAIGRPYDVICAAKQ